MEETLLVDLVEEATLAIPGRYGSEVLLSLLFWTNVAHLDNDQRILAGGTGGEDYICIQLAGCTLDAVAEVFYERRRSGFVKAAVRMSLYKLACSGVVTY